MAKKKLAIYLRYIICKHGLNFILPNQKISVILAQFHSIKVKTYDSEPKGLLWKSTTSFFSQKTLLHGNELLNEIFCNLL
jgi:hypothetical protein